MMCNSEAICRASKEDLMETEVTNKRKKDKQEQEKLDKLTKLQSYVMTYLSGNVSSLKAPEWKKSSRMCSLLLTPELPQK